MKKELDRYLFELQQAIIAAELNYDIWWVYKDQESRKKFIDNMNEYVEFFATSIHAHFVAMLIALYRCYETRRDTININKLTKLLKKLLPNSPLEIDKINEIYDKIKVDPIWKKVSKLRNNLFGHRSSNFNLSEIFNEVAITPNELKSLINNTKEILNRIADLCDEKNIAGFNAKKTTIRLLNDLNELRIIRSGNSATPASGR